MRQVSSALLKVSTEIQHALAQNLPVVALQSTIISHGIPYPQNLQCALSIENTVRNHGAYPATIAIIQGKINVGLSTQEIELLAKQGTNVKKISRRDLANIVAMGKLGATTVSATMIGARMAGIDIFVTGGIGGVHRGYEQSLDVSADLRQLGQTRVSVVSAGVKSILDIPKTLQYLQTEGVPVFTYGSKYFPAFFSQSSGILSPYSVEQGQFDKLARIINAQSELGLDTGMLISVPNPQPAEGEKIEQAIRQALKQCKLNNISGPQTTPFLLKRVNQLTKGDSLKANISLVHNNAKIGSKIAVSLSNLRRNNLQTKYQFSTSKAGRFILIGGSAVDYQVKPFENLDFQLHKSCMGRFRKTLGGISRNMAQCASRLGLRPILITALGKDIEGEHIIKHCHRNNIQVHPIFPPISEQNNLLTGKYLVLVMKDNNQLIGVSDMYINDLITFDNVYNTYFKQNQANLTKNDIVLIDANVNKNSLLQLAMYFQELGITTIYQNKGQKSMKVVETGAWKHLSLLKMNQAENQTIYPAISKLMSLPYNMNQGSYENYKCVGVNNQQSVFGKVKAIITKASKPITVVYADGKQQIYSPPPVQLKDIKKSTGAGDSLTAVLCSMILKGKSFDQALKYGLAGSKYIIQRDLQQSLIPKDLNQIELEKLFQNIYK